MNTLINKATKDLNELKAELWSANTTQATIVEVLETMTAQDPRSDKLLKSLVKYATKASELRKEIKEASEDLALMVR